MEFLQNLNPLIYVAAVYVLMSIVSFITMARDKQIAQRNARRLKATGRVPERTLHVLELLGGWPGSLTAQRIIRHKTQQRAYQVIFWSIVVLHLVGWGIAIGVILTRQ